MGPFLPQPKGIFIHLALCWELTVSILPLRKPDSNGVAIVPVVYKPYLRATVGEGWEPSPSAAGPAVGVPVWRVLEATADVPMERTGAGPTAPCDCLLATSAGSRRLLFVCCCHRCCPAPRHSALRGFRDTDVPFMAGAAQHRDVEAGCRLSPAGGTLPGSSVPCWASQCIQSRQPLLLVGKDLESYFLSQLLTHSSTPCHPPTHPRQNFCRTCEAVPRAHPSGCSACYPGRTPGDQCTQWPQGPTGHTGASPQQLLTTR